MAKKLTAEQKLERAHMQIMRDPNFCLYSGVLMIGKIKILEDHKRIKTAATNGRDVMYAREFVDELDDPEVAFVALHEAMHKMYRHLKIYKHLHKKNHYVANMAMDYVINLEIQDYAKKSINGKDEPIAKMPVNKTTGITIGLIDDRFRGMNTLEVFSILEKENPNPPPPQEGDPSDGQGDGEPSDGQGGGEPSDGCHDVHDWEGAEELTEEENQTLEREIHQALQDGVRLVGKKNGDITRGAIDALEPQVNWVDALRDIIQQTVRGYGSSTWKRLNKKYLAIDVYLPSSRSERVGGICCCNDISYSISDKEEGQYLGEIALICETVKPSQIDLLYWGTQVQEPHEVYRGAEIRQLVNATKPRGGGGTDPDCIPPYLEKHNIKPEIVLIFTDGELDTDQAMWSSVSCPVVWCVINNSRFTAPFGRTIHVEMLND